MTGSARELRMSLIEGGFEVLDLEEKDGVNRNSRKRFDA